MTDPPTDQEGPDKHETRELPFGSYTDNEDDCYDVEVYGTGMAFLRAEEVGRGEARTRVGLLWALRRCKRRTRPDGRLT